MARKRLQDGRGGARQGAQGRAYTNRTDLNQNRQPVRAAAGQPYGERAAQEQAQRALPLPAAPPVPVAPPRPAPGPLPGMLGAFNRPTDYPDEPVTAGSPLGLGPGPEVLAGAWNPNADVEAQILALYKRHQNNDLLRLLRTVRARDAAQAGVGGALAPPVIRPTVPFRGNNASARALPDVDQWNRWARMDRVRMERVPDWPEGYTEEGDRL